MRKILVYLTVLIFMTSCKGQTNERKNKVDDLKINENKMKNDINFTGIEKHLELQENVTCDDVSDPQKEYTPTKEDFDLMLPLLEKSLFNSGYKIPDSTIFYKKILEIFNIDITKSKDNITILYYKDKYKNLYNYVYDNKYNLCISNLFINKEQKIITPMIFLSDLIKIKNLKTQDYNILQNLKVLALNKLLIYEDKASLIYLQSKEPEFVSELLINFGYDQSDILNNFVIDNIYHKDLNSFLKEVVFFKNNKGELKIRKKALESIKNRYLRDKNINNIMPLRYFSSQVILNKEKIYTDEEQMKIIGYLSNVYDPIYKADRYNSNSDWGISDILSDYLYSVSDEEWKTIKKYYEKNHYFGLSHLKEMISYAEQFDEKMGPPDNY